MPKFRKLPVEIEAVQWTGDNFDEVARGNPDITGPYFWEPRLSLADDVVFKEPPYVYPRLKIKTLEGDMWANLLDWVITGINGEPYPCKPDIFEATYCLAEDHGLYWRGDRRSLVTWVAGDDLNNVVGKVKPWLRHHFDMILKNFVAEYGRDESRIDLPVPGEVLEIRVETRVGRLRVPLPNQK